MANSLQCRVVHFEGTVQGVGFRYTTRGIAEDFSVAGFVRNLRDGRVEVVVQGEPNEVERFLRAVEDRLGHYITAKSEDFVSPAADLTSFEIRC
ncbi:MAG: acylphosphatase [Pirellulaceae bacterium]|nr:acylphosphatase [Pirellulaceae bacterium]